MTDAERLLKLPFHEIHKDDIAKRMMARFRAAEDIARHIRLKRNVAHIADTGLGKTISAILAIWLLKRAGNIKRVLFLAPSTYLAEIQHWDLVRKLTGRLDICAIFTGSTLPEKRSWKRPEKIFIYFATPQTVYNDSLDPKFSLLPSFQKNIINPFDARRQPKLDLGYFDLIVEDEFHNAIGDHDYVDIAWAADVLGIPFLGLSASPGGEEARVRAIMTNCHIEKIVTLDLETPKCTLSLCPAKPTVKLKAIENIFHIWLGEIVASLYKLNSSICPTKLIKFKEFQSYWAKAEKYHHYKLLSRLALYGKINHLYRTIITEGFRSYLEAVKDLDSDTTLAAQELKKDFRLDKIYQLIISTPENHPKVDNLHQLVESLKNAGKNGLIFVWLQSTAVSLTEFLRQKGFSVDFLIGGGGRGGLLKQEQKLDLLKNNALDFIVATSVIQEGINVPEVDAVVHFSMPWWEVPRKQRSGRTARRFPGLNIFVPLNHPFDMSLYWHTYEAEQNMDRLLKNGRLLTLEETIEQQLQLNL